MHHALLLEGTLPWALLALPDECRTPGPDVIHYGDGRMGIDEVRELIRMAYQTPSSGIYRHFVLTYSDFTLEAQNALLKLFEEPPQSARFYIVITEAGKLLPTLRSRLFAYRKEERTFPGTDAFASFLQSSYADRLSIISDHIVKKDDAWAEELLRSIESYAQKGGHTSLMRTVSDLRPVFSMPGTSKKMILEHIALMLPSASK